MNIRALQKEDLSKLLTLYTHLNVDDLPLPPRAKVDAIWDELCNNGSYRYFGGFVGQQLVSSCNLTIIPNLTRGCQPYGLIENVVTHAAHRNKGYGKALLAHALDAAWLAGCYKVMLMTGRKDPATLHFYAAAGFDSGEKQAFIAKPKP
jgi:GNAT superfamily N-acetyltransferase